ncbi:fatty-acyl-CoA synthase [Actinoalloteichus cyanogriseus DSM 43889]|uniref:Fatty-acyl-CoA synthase n=1 Tax=Actinoalloteichus caeruleus DSM 43889 TaxID=1120930 RepID=A0ABT1JMU6_ACTCY|nr:fatty-acyl-CoA synthase [Actinoalloteichus caeruleus DSM 43889]
MTRVEVRRTFAQSPDRLWSWLGEPTTYPSFLPEVTRLQPVGHEQHAPGDRYQLSRRGTAGRPATHLTVEVRDAARRIVLSQGPGDIRRLEFRLRPLHGGGTEVRFGVETLVSGPVRRLLDSAGAPVLRRWATRALVRLSHAAEGWPAGHDARASRRGHHLVERWRDLRVLVNNGVLRPDRPDRMVRLAGAWWRWGTSLPLGYTAAAVRHPDRAALIDEHGAVSFAELSERTTRLANALADRGLGETDAVALLCGNHRLLVELLIACSKLGVRTVLLSPRLNADQVSGLLREQRARTVVADAEYRPLLVRAPRNCQRITAWVDAPTRALTVEQLIADFPATPLGRKAAEGTTIVLTSGTGGVARAVPWQDPPRVTPASTVFTRVPLREGERTLMAAPLAHTRGLSALHLCAVLGATLVLRRDFSPGQALREAAQHRCTSMFVQPDLLRGLLDLPPAERLEHDLGSLRAVVSTGAPLPADLAADFQREFGPLLYNLYGSTDVSWVSIATPTDLSAAPGTVGRPPRGIRIAILDEDGNPLPAGREGRIHVGTHASHGRHREDVGGEPPFPELVFTGDLGHVDVSGRLFVRGRERD